MLWFGIENVKTFHRNYKKYLDDEKIIVWFGQNGDIDFHPKFRPIPIGIANRCWPWGNAETIDHVRQNMTQHERSILLYFNCSLGTHPERRLVSSPKLRYFLYKLYVRSRV